MSFVRKCLVIAFLGIVFSTSAEAHLPYTESLSTALKKSEVILIARLGSAKPVAAAVKRNGAISFQLDDVEILRGDTDLSVLSFAPYYKIGHRYLIFLKQHEQGRPHQNPSGCATPDCYDVIMALPIVHAGPDPAREWVAFEPFVIANAEPLSMVRETMQTCQEIAGWHTVYMTCGLERLRHLADLQQVKLFLKSGGKQKMAHGSRLRFADLGTRLASATLGGIVTLTHATVKQRGAGSTTYRYIVQTEKIEFGAALPTAICSREALLPGRRYFLLLRSEGIKTCDASNVLLALPFAQQGAWLTQAVNNSDILLLDPVDALDTAPLQSKAHLISVEQPDNVAEPVASLVRADNYLLYQDVLALIGKVKGSTGP